MRRLPSRTGRPAPALPGSAALLAVLLVALLVVAGCAPLEPESRRASPSPSPSAARTPEPQPDTQPGRESGAGPGKSTEPPARQGPADDITVPPGLEEVRPLDRPLLGADISWPQCPTGMGIPERRTLGLPMPVPEAEYVVVGLTNGPGFTTNPCLADQLAWVRERGLLVAAYSVLSAPYGDQLRRHGADGGPYDGSTRLGAMRNVGYAQARYNLATMERVGFPSPIVWLDVEPVPGFDWPRADAGQRAANAAVVEGAARGYTDAGYRVGVYSTAYMWSDIVGDLELGVPEWRTAGLSSRAEALRRCGEDARIQGGEPVLTQWLQDDRDFNLTCPGTPLRLTDYFART